MPERWRRRCATNIAWVTNTSEVVAAQKKGNGYFRKMTSVFDNIGVGDQLGELNYHSRHFERHVATAEEGRDTSSASHRVALQRYGSTTIVIQERSRVGCYKIASTFMHVIADMTDLLDDKCQTNTRNILVLALDRYVQPNSGYCTRV